MDRNPKSSEESKPEVITRSVLASDVFFVDYSGQLRVIRAGALLETAIEFVDKNGNLLGELRLW